MLVSLSQSKGGEVKSVSDELRAAVYGTHCRDCRTIDSEECRLKEYDADSDCHCQCHTTLVSVVPLATVLEKMAALQGLLEAEAAGAALVRGQSQIAIEKLEEKVTALERENAEFKRIRDLLVRALMRAIGTTDKNAVDDPLTAAIQQLIVSLP